MTNKAPYIVDTAWLEVNINNPNIRIIDATTQLKYPQGNGYYTLESGIAAFNRNHIPGAVYADLLNNFSDIEALHPLTVSDSAQFAREIGALGVSNDTHVVIYDQLDVEQWPEYYPFWASRLWWQLRLEGHDNVSVLEGGLGKWKSEGRGLESGPRTVTPVTFNTNRRTELLATIDQVATAIDSANTVLVNVQNEAAFTGSLQVYERAGHIPTSKHLFFGDVIDIDSGRYKTTDEVRPLFEKLGLLNPDKKPVIYCGSGIAATIVALQLARAGREDVAVYDGSMTEWAADDTRPLVVTA